MGSYYDDTDKVLQVLNKNTAWVRTDRLRDLSGCDNVKGRIHALRQDGWDIASRRAKGSKFSEYRLLGRKATVPNLSGVRVWVREDHTLAISPFASSEDKELAEALTEACRSAVTALLTRRGLIKAEEEDEEPNPFAFDTFAFAYDSTDEDDELGDLDEWLYPAAPSGPDLLDLLEDVE